uniref:Uncharacterized protein n=1 Tax=Clytia hemisphaerica TaxID=252671 RepID=A0A7M5UUT0_9CNID
MTLGIGKFDTKKLKRWATKPSWFFAADFKDFAKVFSEMKDDLCKVAKDVEEQELMVAEVEYCKLKYANAKHCYAFEESNKNYVFDSITFNKAIMNCGAKLVSDEFRGFKGRVLTLNDKDDKCSANQFPSVDLGPFKGECSADPTLCTNGITISFWLKMEENVIAKMKSKGFNEFYVWASGGLQIKNRGYALVYRNGGFELHLQHSEGGHVIKMTSFVYSKWFHISFTWSASEGLRYYQDGVLSGSSTSYSKKFAASSQTSMTIGRLNNGVKNAKQNSFADFRMDDLVIYERILALKEIEYMAGKQYALTSNIYYYARWFWAWKRLWHHHEGNGEIMYSPMYFQQDSINNAGILKNKPRLEFSSKRGYHLRIREATYAYMGDYKGTCISDPDLCLQASDGMQNLPSTMQKKTLQAGLTVSFWLSSYQGSNGKGGAIKKYYYISSGGKMSKGFSLYYDGNAQKWYLLLRTKSHYYEIAFTGITFATSKEEQWVFFAFTWSLEGGVKVYVNGENIQSMTPKEAKAEPTSKDQFTKLYIGTRNDEPQFLKNVFSMNLLAIYYYELPKELIVKLYNDEDDKEAEKPEVVAPQPQKPVPAPGTPTKDCLVKADIVLLIDGSGSITNLGKKYVGPQFYLRFVYPAIQKLIKSLPISEDNIHLGFVFFGADNLEKVVEEEGWYQELDSAYSSKEISTWFTERSKKGIFPRFKSTFTDEGVAYATKMLQRSKRFKDDSVKKLLFIITDGEPTVQSRADASISKFKENNWGVMALGIGQFDDEKLKAWATKPEWFFKTSFKELTKVLSGMKNEICEVAEQTEQQDLMVAEVEYCKLKYANAKHCYAFEESNKNYVFDSITFNKAIMNCGAKLVSDAFRGFQGRVLTLNDKDDQCSANQFPSVDLGPFKGECSTDPTLCTNGITISFWLKMEENAIAKMKSKGFNEFYVWASGGLQLKNRGYALVYRNGGFELHLQHSEGGHVIKMTSFVYSKWFHISFTWSASEGLRYYQDGVLSGSSTSYSQKFAASSQTSMTIGRLNNGVTNTEQNSFSDFRMDDLVIYERILALKEIEYMAGTKYALTSNIYYYARWFWAWKRLWHHHEGNGEIMYSPMYFQQDSINNAGILENKPRLMYSATRGYHLRILSSSYAYMGDFAKTCVSDPDLCLQASDGMQNVPSTMQKKTLQAGLTVSFWLSSYQGSNGKGGAIKKYYYISSGGRMSKGFSLYYDGNAQKWYLLLRTKSHYYEIAFTGITFATSKEEQWTFFAFTWSPEVGVNIYVNGKMIKSMTPKEAKAESTDSDQFTKLYIGTRNDEPKFLRNMFSMNLLAIYYYALPKELIVNLYKEEDGKEPEKELPKAKPEKRYCDIKYAGAEYCYAFEEFNGVRISDSMKTKQGTMHCGAKLVDTKFEGMEGFALSLLERDNTCATGDNPWVDLEAFRGTCMKDPDSCRTSGFSISLWLLFARSDFEMSNSRIKYVFTSGGNFKSRGIMMWFEGSKGFMFRIQTSKTSYTISLGSLPFDSWFHLVLVWPGSNVILSYVNGEITNKVTYKQTQVLTGEEKGESFERLVIGKINSNEKMGFGRFLMDDLVIYQKVMTMIDVEYLYGRRDGQIISNVYYLSRWLWAFKRMWHQHRRKMRGIMYSPLYFDNENTEHAAVSYGNAKLELISDGGNPESLSVGYVLTLSAFGDYINFGNYEKTCVSDPDQCDSATDASENNKNNEVSDNDLERGLSVSFYISMITAKKQDGGDRRYIISSGGQNENSRGFAIFYVVSTDKYRFQLRTKDYFYDVEFTLSNHSDDVMTFFAFSWSAKDGLRIYIDGKIAVQSKGKEMKHSTDQNTLLTVGKPNDEDKNFGIFRMDLLAIYYYRLTSKYILALYNRKDYIEPFKSNQRYCKLKYGGSEFCYAFEERKKNQISDSMKFNQGELHCGARLTYNKYNGHEGSVLSLLEKDASDKSCSADEKPWLQLKKLEDNCLSDPDLCQSNGFSISMWLLINAKDYQKTDSSTKYIFTSGGNNVASRGIAMWFEGSKGFMFRIQTSKISYTISLGSLPFDSWFHLVLVWPESSGSSNDQILYYLNGNYMRRVTNRISQTYQKGKDFDVVVGKHENKKIGFARFMMNDLVVYYRRLTLLDIQFIYGARKAYRVRSNFYYLARWFWSFKRLYYIKKSEDSEMKLYSPLYFDQDDISRAAVSYNMATIKMNTYRRYGSGLEYSLYLEQMGDYLVLGDYKGSCVSDPDQCDSATDASENNKNNEVSDKDLERGLSVSFYISMVPAKKQDGGDRRYIISSGGQNENSRGFAIFYVVSTEKYKLQLRTGSIIYDVDFDLSTTSDDVMSFFAFTWSSKDGLRIYIDGKMAVQSKGKEMKQSTDQNTLLTVGTPNDENKDFGIFRMDLLAIYFYRLTSVNIMSLYNEQDAPKIVADKQYCNIKYAGAEYCYDFEDQNGNQIADSMKQKLGTVQSGARLTESSYETFEGSVLSLMGKENDDSSNAQANEQPWIDLKNYADTCLMDKFKCDAMTISFWLFLKQEDFKGNSKKTILSSGKLKTRHLALWFNGVSSGFVFRFQSSPKNVQEIKFKSIPFNTWNHMVFVQKSATEWVYYLNAKKTKGSSTIKEDSQLTTDVESVDFYIGKSHERTGNYGRFLMNDFVIYYKALSDKEISLINGQVTKDTVVPSNAYYYARWLWMFHQVWYMNTVPSSQRLIYIPMYYDIMKKKKPSSDIDMKHVARLHGSARVIVSKRRLIGDKGYHLLLQNVGDFVVLGNYKGTCVSDPEICDSTTESNQNLPNDPSLNDHNMEKGLSVSFWLSITTDDVNIEGSPVDRKHQYIISSGGQTSNSRGFAILYDAETEKFKLQLQTSTKVFNAEFDIPFADSPDSKGWAFICFTYSKKDGVKIYIDGKMVTVATSEDKSHPTDIHTKLTIGISNYVSTKHFGRFQMDLLAIYYYRLVQQQIEKLSKDEAYSGDNTDPITTTTTTTEAPTTSTTTQEPIIPLETTSTTPTTTTTVAGETEEQSDTLTTTTTTTTTTTPSPVEVLLNQGQPTTSTTTSSDDQQQQLPDIQPTTSTTTSSDDQQQQLPDIQPTMSTTTTKTKTWLGNMIDLIGPKYDNNVALPTSTTTTTDQQPIIAQLELDGGDTTIKTTVAPVTTSTTEIPDLQPPTTTTTTASLPDGAVIPPDDGDTGNNQGPGGAILPTTTTTNLPPSGGIIVPGVGVDPGGVLPTTSTTTSGAGGNTVSTTTTAFPVVPTQTTTTISLTGSTKCTSPMDVVFLVDNSGSIESGGKEGYFKNVKSFFKSLASKFEISDKATRIAVVEAATDPLVVSNFGSIKNEKELKTVFTNENMPTKKGRTFLGKALDLVRTEVIDKTRDVGKIVVIVTDGYSTDDIRTPSKQLQDNGVIIFGVAFGPDSPLKRRTMQDLVSRPTAKYNTLVNYDQLVESSLKIAKHVCEVGLDAPMIKESESIDKNPISGEVTDEFKKKFLEETNQYRRLHSASGLTWSMYLTTKAQQWAEHIASKDKVLERPVIGAMRQAICVMDENEPTNISAKRCVQAWYNQIINYNFVEPEMTEKNKYFVQLVWRSTSDVGVGKFESASGKTYVVAFFTTVGGGEGEEDDLKSNVLPVTNALSNGYLICPVGYENANSYCYKFFADKKTWEEASMTCASEKSSLISLTKDTEFSNVLNTMRLRFVPKTWIGLANRMKPTIYNWVDGSAFSFSGWASTPPTNENNKQCVTMDTSRGWLNTECTNKELFICKTHQASPLTAMVTLHYPMDVWTEQLVTGDTPEAISLVQRINNFITTVYNGKTWFESFNVKSLRGHLSVYVDVELHFGTTCPTDPLKPLKDVVFTEDCSGFICDLADAQIMPAPVTCATTSCYTSCTPSCPPQCCSPITLPTTSTYQIVQPNYTPTQQQLSTADPQYCASSCHVVCANTCPNQCCSIQGRQRRKKRNVGFQ